MTTVKMHCTYPDGETSTANFRFLQFEHALSLYDQFQSGDDEPTLVDAAPPDWDSYHESSR